MFGLKKIKGLFIKDKMDEKPKTKKAAGEDFLKPQAEEEFDFVKFTSLEDFGYSFNEDRQLRNIKTGEPFEFKVREDHKYNQKRYETIGEIITEHVYTLLEEEGKLMRIPVPLDDDKMETQDEEEEKEEDGATAAGEDSKESELEPKSFIFVSDDYKTNKDKLMVLIHGSGVVRAGQWARRLIINDDLDKGTQLPYIKRAREEGYAVMVLNTNNNVVNFKGKDVPVRRNGRPEEHGAYVWEEIISKLPAKNIAIVAHSYGGIVTTVMASQFAEEFEKRVFAIAFTDSVHSLEWQQAPESITKLYHTKALNWVSSDEPLDKPVRQPRNDAPRVSAGHPKHEWTSCSALPSVFKFFGKKYTEFTKSEL